MITFQLNNSLLNWEVNQLFNLASEYDVGERKPLDLDYKIARHTPDRQLLGGPAVQFATRALPG